METLKLVILITHFVGLAAIIGPALDQLRKDAKKITSAMVWGARAQIATGVILVGLRYALDEPVDNVKITIKLVLALAIAAIAEMSRKKASVTWQYWAVAALTVANIAVAVLWR